MRKALVASVLALALPLGAWAQEPARTLKPVGDHHEVTIHIIVTIRVEVVPTPGPGPGPSPTPKPPDPAPPPTPDPPKPPEPLVPAPIPADGLHVLIQYESRDRLTPEQHSIIYGKEIRDYLNSKCPLGPNGKTHQWRIWDKDVTGYDDSKLWGDAQKRAAAKGGWIIISNGRTGYEGPLPASVEETIKLLEKYSVPSRRKAAIEEWSDKDN